MEKIETKENLVSELEALKKFRVTLDRFLQLIKYIHNDLETTAGNMEMVQDLNQKWSKALEKPMTEGKQK